METLLQLVVLFMVVLSVAFLWLAKPIERVVETASVGKVREILLFGFFVPLENLSNNLNRLEKAKDDALKKARKLDKQISDEKKLIEAREKAIQEQYRAHLNEHGDKRRWWYLFRKVPVPQQLFLKEEMDGRTTEVKSGRTTNFLLEGFPRPPGIPPETVWEYRSKSNQDALDRNANTRNRGGNANANQQKGSNQK